MRPRASHICFVRLKPDATSGLVAEPDATSEPVAAGTRRVYASPAL